MDLDDRFEQRRAEIIGDGPFCLSSAAYVAVREECRAAFGDEGVSEWNRLLALLDNSAIPLIVVRQAAASSIVAEIFERVWSERTADLS